MSSLSRSSPRLSAASFIAVAVVSAVKSVGASLGTGESASGRRALALARVVGRHVSIYIELQWC